MGFRRVGKYGFNLMAPVRSNLPFFRLGQPYRLAEGRLLCLHSGTISMELDLEEHFLEAGDIVLAMPDTLAMLNDVAEGTVVSIIAFDRLDARGESFVARCDTDTLLRVEKYIELIQMQQKRVGDHDEIVAHLAETFILDVQSLRTEVASGSDSQFMHRFLSLLSKEGRVKHPIEFYADRLCLSAGYVSTMVKRHSDMTVLQWIDRALVREAKVLLHHTQMPVAEVAETLGFATPSFFIRFFRQQTGQTPLQYRKGN